MQGYELAVKTLEAQHQKSVKTLETQYQARLEDKDKVINQLISRGNVSIHYQPNAQFAGGIVAAQTVNVEQIGGDIQN